MNINGVLRCFHAVLPHLTAQGSGDILVTSSISGFVDIAGEPIYSASKHAVQGLVHTLRRQVAPSGVRVMSLAPGMVANELWGITDEAEIAQRVAERAWLRSEDVAEAAVFMLSQPPHVTDPRPRDAAAEAGLCREPTPLAEAGAPDPGAGGAGVSDKRATLRPPLWGGPL